MDSILTPDLLKLVAGLISLGWFIVRKIEQHERERAESKRAELEEGRQYRQQMLTLMRGLQGEQARLSEWAADHERADRLRFRRIERRLSSVLPPEGRHAAGWLL